MAIAQDGQARGGIIKCRVIESGNFTTGGWTIEGGDATVAEAAAYTDTYGAKLKKATWIEKAVSTVGYETIHVKYRRQTNAFDSGENLVVEWYDGSDWNNLETIQSASYGDGLQDKTCASGADDNADFKVRFITNAGAGNEYAYLDDIVISGTAAADTTQVSADPANGSLSIMLTAATIKEFRLLLSGVLLVVSSAPSPT